MPKVLAQMKMNQSQNIQNKRWKSVLSNRIRRKSTIHKKFKIWGLTKLGTQKGQLEYLQSEDLQIWTILAWMTQLDKKWNLKTNRKTFQKPKSDQALAQVQMKNQGVTIHPPTTRKMNMIRRFQKLRMLPWKLKPMVRKLSPLSQMFLQLDQWTLSLKNLSSYTVI